MVCVLHKRDATAAPLVPCLGYDPRVTSEPIPPSRPDLPAAEYDRAWVREHLADERRKASLLGEIREAIFGAQDGLVSTLAVVSTVAGASADRVPVLIAGIATGLAGVFSMAAGEYMSSKSQREIFAAQITGEREEVLERPGEAEAEMAYMLEEDGLPRSEASAMASTLAAHPEVLLKTMVEKELGLAGEHAEGTPVPGRAGDGRQLRPGLARAGARLPRPADRDRHLGGRGGERRGALRDRRAEVALDAAAVAALRPRDPACSGAFAGIAGFLFGNVLPTVLGASVAPL